MQWNVLNMMFKAYGTHILWVTGSDTKNRCKCSGTSEKRGHCFSLFNRYSKLVMEPPRTGGCKWLDRTIFGQLLYIAIHKELDHKLVSCARQSNKTRTSDCTCASWTSIPGIARRTARMALRAWTNSCLCWCDKEHESLKSINQQIQNFCIPLSQWTQRYRYI